MIRDERRGLFFLYRRAIWYFSIGIDEIRKPLRLQNELVGFITLGAVYGITVNWKIAIITYVIIFILGVIFGKFLVWIGVLKYDQGLTNYENVELMGVIEKLNKIQQTLDERKDK